MLIHILIFLEKAAAALLKVLHALPLEEYLLPEKRRLINSHEVIEIDDAFYGTCEATLGLVLRTVLQVEVLLAVMAKDCLLVRNLYQR